jgi:riboflavin kinase/FMN adenylyltransferase
MNFPMKQRVVALGFFDGVHLGHGALLRRTVEEARSRGCTSAVYTFDRPPKEVITGEPCFLINSPEDRQDLVRRLYGIDEVLMVPFDDELRTTPWDQFVTEIMMKRYHAVHLVAGHDHHFGSKNAGSPELLTAKCAEMGIGCDIISKVERGGITVSSTYIRRLIELGQVERAAEFLGHPHLLTQTVRHGRSIGHAQLFPTINQPLPTHVLAPAHGVYITRAVLPDGAVCPGVTNVGTRPTVNNGSDVTVETFLLDFEGDLYGKTVRLEFCRRLRDERRFDSLDALKAQIASDAETARTYFREQAAH